MSKQEQYYSVFGQDNNGNWRVIRPDGLLCSGKWKTRESAQDDSQQMEQPKKFMGHHMSKPGKPIGWRKTNPRQKIAIRLPEDVIAALKQRGKITEQIELAVMAMLRSQESSTDSAR